MSSIPMAPPPPRPLTDGAAEYLALSERLKLLRGMDFEQHGHPAVVLDRATSPSTLVWGWWADVRPAIPCILWASERGWSVTVVEAGALDSEGYERAFWSHRITLLDLALANAIGPFPTLEQLELNVAADGSFGLGPWACELREAVLWGIGQLQAVQASRHRGRGTEPHPGPTGGPCSVDQELSLHGLAPTNVKSRRSVESAQEAGLEALLRAVRRTDTRLSDVAAGTRRSARPGGSRGGR